MIKPAAARKTGSFDQSHPTSKEIEEYCFCRPHLPQCVTGLLSGSLGGKVAGLPLAILCAGDFVGENCAPLCLPTIQREQVQPCSSSKFEIFTSLSCALDGNSSWLKSSGSGSFSGFLSREISSDGSKHFCELRTPLKERSSATFVLLQQYINGWGRKQVFHQLLTKLADTYRYHSTYIV